MELTGTGEEWLFSTQEELIARFWNGMLITSKSSLSHSSVGRSAKDQADVPTLLLTDEQGQGDPNRDVA